MNDQTWMQDFQLLTQLEQDLHELEVSTFEIEDILDSDQIALSSSCSSCVSCSKTPDD